MIIPKTFDLFRANFVNVSETESLFVHPKWKGLYMKRVASVEQALDAGGVALYHPVTKNWWIAVGRAARVAHHHNLFGKYSQPAQIKAFPVGHPTPPWTNGSEWQIDSVVAIQSTIDVEHVNPAECYLMAVVTQANDGLLMYRDAGTITFTVEDLTTRIPEVSAPAYNGEYRNKAAAITHPGRAKGKYVGFLSLVDYQETDRYIMSRANDLMATVPQKLQAHYARELPKAASQVASEMPFTPGWAFTLNAHPDGGWIHGSPIKRHGPMAPPMNMVARFGLFGRAGTGSSPPGTYPVVQEAFLRGEYLARNRGEKLPVVEFQIAPGSQTFEHAAGVSEAISWYKPGVNAGFDAMSVPAQTVVSHRGNLFVSSLVAAILPASRPASERSGSWNNTTEEERISAGYDLVRYTNKPFVPDVDDAKTVTMAIQRFDDIEVAGATADELYLSLTETSYVYSRFLDEWDKGVKQALGV